MHIPVGIRSLAMSLPHEIRTNDYYKERYPEIVAQSEEKTLARFMSLTNSTPTNEYELAMEPYLKDPFRGTVKRPIIGKDESALNLEYRAAKEALDAGNFSVDDIDLLIVASLLSDQPGFGNAAFLARELGLKCALWNLDAHSSAGVLALQTATSLVQTGTYKNILVVVSSTYSRLGDEEDTLSWFLGDAGCAYIVGPLSFGQGIIASKAINTSFTCDQIIIKDAVDNFGNHVLRIISAEGGNRVFTENVSDMIKIPCQGALDAANLTPEDIDFFIFPSPGAWFVDFCARLLKINPERTINLYPEYGNIAPVLSFANLYHAVKEGKIRENDLVLMHAFGAASSSIAVVMRWGDVSLGSISDK